MPEVLKENGKPKPQPPKKKENNVWDNVADIASADHGGLHISIYGRGKTGKTRLLGTAPKPLLIIGFEDGTRSIRGIPGIKFVRVTKSYDLAVLADEAVKRGFASVGIDNASDLQGLVLKEILGLEEIPQQLSWGLATREQYGTVSLEVKTLLERVLNLPLHVAIIAHERNFNDDSASSPDLVLPSVGSALSPSTTNWLNGKVDYICQTFIRKQTKLVKKTVGNESSNVKVETGKKEFCLRIGVDPVYMTGFRLPPGCQMPDVIVDPTFDKLSEVAQGKWKPPVAK